MRYPTTLYKRLDFDLSKILEVKHVVVPNFRNNCLLPVFFPESVCLHCCQEFHFSVQFMKKNRIQNQAYPCLRYTFKCRLISNLKYFSFIQKTEQTKQLLECSLTTVQVIKTISFKIS